jgi:hypothetical protein
MDTNTYTWFLLIGVLMVVIDGQIIYRSGRRYLESSYGDPRASASMTRLIAVLFHLAVLGILALLSTIDMGGNTMTVVVGKLGVMLLVLAIAHGITVAVLARIRDEQVGESLVTQRHEAMGTAPADGPRDAHASGPLPGQRLAGSGPAPAGPTPIGADGAPMVSPPIDQNAYPKTYPTAER